MSKNIHIHNVSSHSMRTTVLKVSDPYAKSHVDSKNARPQQRHAVEHPDASFSVDRKMTGYRGDGKRLEVREAKGIRFYLAYRVLLSIFLTR
ncbi:hypothetical protein J5I95_13655 [Candidatus Poribacteria bacterium]|nr:hypothetical protein [Candidatus Poribacteria bacterium]